MEPKEFTDLTDNEITEAIKDILSEYFSRIDVKGIERDYDKEEMMVTALMDDQFTKMLLHKPVGFPALRHAGIQLFSKNACLNETQEGVIEKKYYQFLFAALYRDFIKDNPYLENYSNTTYVEKSKQPMKKTEYEHKQNSGEEKACMDFTITERTEPFALQEVLDFIDETNISKLDACELKSRIVNLLQAEREQATSEYEQSYGDEVPELD